MSKIHCVDRALVEQITELRKEKNFQTIKEEIGEERLKEFIHAVYPKFTITEIEKITGIPDSTLGYWFKQLGIPFIAHHVTIRAVPGSQDGEMTIEEDGSVRKIVMVKITPELAYAVGFALGDGSIQQYQVEVFNKDKHLKTCLFNILKQYGHITEEERENGLWRLRLSSVKIASLIKDKKGIRQDTLDYIFRNDKLAKKFIAGFWDAEGTVLYQKEKKYYNLYLYNSNHYLMDRIEGFFKRGGIKFSIHKRPTRDESYLLKGRWVKSKKELIRLNIHKVSWGDWIKEIGLSMNHGKKREMINKINNFYGGTQNGK